MSHGRIGTLLALALLGGFALAACSGPPPPPPEPACTVDDDCPIGSVCTDGTCEQLVCPQIFDPVCGVDGQTYGNACEARAAHVAVAHEGACAATCGGIGGGECPGGQFCDPPQGECDSPDAQGTCVPRPEVCSEEFDPVCGCDGQTYSNDCERLMAGVGKDHDGECAADASDGPAQPRG